MKKFSLKLVDYNRWRYEKIFYSILRENKYAQLLEKDSGLYFRTIKGTLNHLIVGDYLWYSRLKGQSRFETPFDTTGYQYPAFQIQNSKISNYWAEDVGEIEKVFENQDTSLWFNNYQQRFFDMNSEWYNFLDSLEESDFSKEFEYINTEMKKNQQNRFEVVYHIINHHTHHLGQVTAAITNYNQNLDYFPSTDFTYYLNFLETIKNK